ncbi:MAG: 30S ribosomal protein S16 [bacterium]|nr:30S ribosomal protein S16 [bacterium]
MLAIKFRRVGKKHQASFHVVVDPKRTKLLGENVEDLGWYNPHTKKHALKADRVLYWIKNGAQPTPSVNNLLINAGIIEGSKLPVHKKSKKSEEENAAPATEMISRSVSAEPAAEEKPV